MPKAFIVGELSDFLSAQSLTYKLPSPQHPMDPPHDHRPDIKGRISQFWTNGKIDN
jgi:hypothetical protein